MGAAVTDPLAQALFAGAGIMLLVVVLRGRLLRRLDAWVYPETADQRQALGTATSALAQASQVRTIARWVARTVNQGCGSRATLLVAADTGTGDYASLDGGMAPLARGSAVVHMLARGGGSVRVHPNDSTSVFELLPRTMRRGSSRRGPMSWRRCSVPARRSSACWSSAGASTTASKQSAPQPTDRGQ